LVDKLLSWKNSGFNIHNQVKIQSHNSHGRESLAQYILRSPFSQQKMTYRKDTKTVLYRSKMIKRNFAVFPVLDWIAAITAHIPNKGEQLIRYYGTYSNVSRGKRKKEKPKRGEAVTWKTEVTEVPPPLVSKELKSAGLTSSKWSMKHTPLSVSSGHWLYPCGPHQAAIIFQQFVGCNSIAL